MPDTSEQTLAQKLYFALAYGDRDALDALLHADFVGEVTPGMPCGIGGDYHGPAEMRRGAWGAIAKHFDAKAEPSSFVSLADGRLVVAGTYRGSGRVSGKPLNARFIHTLSFADGQIIRLEQLTDSHAWHEALGDAGEVEKVDTVLYSVKDGVATIRLNRPQERNAINQQLADELLVVARRCSADPEVRCVLIDGNGPALTVGGDIKFFTESDSSYGELFRRMTGPFHEAFRILSRLQVPIVTAAHGSIAGGGLGLAYIADFVLVAEGTKFATGFSAIGLSGDGGGSWFLPRLVGPRRAAQLMMQNKVLDAREAVEWGIATEVVPAEELQERSRALALELAAGPTKAFGHMRALLQCSWTNSLSEQLLDETERLASTGNTDDAINAIASFVMKRTPVFEGR